MEDPILEHFHLKNSIREELEYLIRQLEIERTGEMPELGNPPRGEQFAEGYKSGKQLALTILMSRLAIYK